jgi:hypothetical protein
VSQFFASECLSVHYMAWSPVYCKFCNVSSTFAILKLFVKVQPTTTSFETLFAAYV